MRADQSDDSKVSIAALFPSFHRFCGVIMSELWDRVNPLCMSGDVEKLRELAEEVGSDVVVAARSGLRWGGLHVACSSGREEVALQLIEW